MPIHGRVPDSHRRQVANKSRLFLSYGYHKRCSEKHLNVLDKKKFPNAQKNLDFMIGWKYYTCGTIRIKEREADTDNPK